MKPRLAFVDHSFHQKTRSGDFLRNLFSAQFEVVDFWDDSWEGGTAVTAAEINAGNFSHVFFFQSFLPSTELRQLQPVIMWAPMYDALRDKTPGYWLELTTIPMKILCFSTTLAKQLQSYGFDIYTTQYWFDPATLPQVSNYSSIRVFFWQRRDITFAQVKALLGDTLVEKCIVKLNPDPLYQSAKPTATDIDRYHITVVEGFMDKAEYLRQLQQCNVFISPRRYEGIGMSFLEAMAMGLVVVGMNHATINEYIQTNDIGRLFDEQFHPVNLSNLPALGQHSRQAARSGFTQWQLDCPRILQFMTTPLKPAQANSLALKLKIKYHTGLYVLKHRLQNLSADQ